MEKDRISEFLGSINSEKWNCVYQANGMTLLTTKEYDYNYEERVSLKTQLKLINKEYERLNKENGRGFAITSVKQYNIDELVRYKDNWNKLKEYIDKTKIEEFEKSYGKRYGKTFTQAEIIVCNMIKDKMKELEGSVSNVKN